MFQKFFSKGSNSHFKQHNSKSLHCQDLSTLTLLWMLETNTVSRFNDGSRRTLMYQVRPVWTSYHTDNALVHPCVRTSTECWSHLLRLQKPNRTRNPSQAFKIYIMEFVCETKSLQTVQKYERNWRQQIYSYFPSKVKAFLIKNHFSHSRNFPTTMTLPDWPHLLAVAISNLENRLSAQE